MPVERTIPDLSLSWGFETVADGRRLTINLGPGDAPVEGLERMNAFVWAYGGTTLDGEQMQPIDLGDLAVGKCVKRSWTSSEPYMHSLFISCDGKVVQAQEIKPKSP